METQRLLSSNHITNTENECSEEEWSDGSSYSSYYSDSDSTIPDWEPYVDDISGELFYIECHPFVTQNKDSSKSKENPEPFSKSQLRRSTRGKFLRLIRRRESKRRSKKAFKTQDTSDNNTSKVKFQDFQEGEEKEVLLEIDADNRHNLSSDVSLAESLLGLNVSTLSDGYRVMIAGFSIDSKAKNERNIKIGDWLKSINNIEVNYKNLDDILQKYINRNEVLLKLQRVAGIEVTKDPPINELNNESLFVRELINISKTDENQALMQDLCKHPVGVVYINTEKLSETNTDNDDVIYCFPRPQQKNILCNARGMFLTIHHLLKDVTNSYPKTTSFTYKNRLCNVAYTLFDKNLLLFMLPDNKATIKEIELIKEELIRFIQFSYETIDKCFTQLTTLNQIDHFFIRFFIRILNNGQWTTTQDFAEMHITKLMETSAPNFEEILSAAKTLTLPYEAQMQIDDALAELEASDYRDWNEEPLDCQRLFTVIGSALYHAGYLLATHFIHADLIDVHSFCKQQGLLHLSCTEPVKSLVLWREVFPYSCNRINNPELTVPDGKRYLLVVGSAKNLLVVIMEAGGCTEPAEDNMGPDAFYVEEAQATLAHVQELGLGELADRLLAMSPGTQTVLPVPVTNKKKSDLMSTLNLTKSVKDENLSQKKHEVTSILKRRSSDQNFIVQGSSMTSLHDDCYDVQSEGSGSQGGYSERSEISDELNGKRKKYDSNDEESETDDYADGSQMSSSSFDISEMRQTLLTETEDYRPMQLTSGGENVLFYFVQLDTTEGIIICPPESSVPSQTLDIILNKFRECCQKIHALFQNTLRFKNMPAQDMAKSVMNKSLIAIKEHGIMFECPFVDEKDLTKKIKISYCVIGRLFFMPHPREVYICYQDTVPQNIVEIAFKINMNTIS